MNKLLIKPFYTSISMFFILKLTFLTMWHLLKTFCESISQRMQYCLIHKVSLTCHERIFLWSATDVKEWFSPRPAFVVSCWTHSCNRNCCDSGSPIFQTRHIRVSPLLSLVYRVLTWSPRTPWLSRCTPLCWSLLWPLCTGGLLGQLQQYQQPLLHCPEN